MPSGVKEVRREDTVKAESLSARNGGSSSVHEDHSLGKDEQIDSEGVEVVLAESGSTKIVEESRTSRPPTDQNVFRHPQPVRPRAMRAPSGQPPPQPYLHGSGSWGYGPPFRHGEYPPPPRGYPVPPYGASASFEDHGYHPTPHYSPPIQYPPPGGRYGEQVNVISPNHKTEPNYRPLPPRSRYMPPPHGYYQYPPTSPVSRTGGHSSSTTPPRRGHSGPYSKAQREPYRPADGSWNANRRQPPLVTESSFDSEHRSHQSHPPTPGGSLVAPSSHVDPHYQFYGGGGSWGSFDVAEDKSFYGPPPELPYSGYMAPYSPGGIYAMDSFPGPHYGPNGSFSYSYDEDDRMAHNYYPDHEKATKQVTPPGNKGKGRKGSSHDFTMLLPKAAEEVEFDVTDPPMEPITPQSEKAICESMTEVNGYDVLCGRGGGTNSQIGNRRFRKLVQDFQPTYLLARRKEKPLLARSIVLIIRKRGGRFLKKDEETGALYEVGDAKAEAKTSQALREGLDVRATKNAASSLLDKKKKKSKDKYADEEDDDDDYDVSPVPTPSRKASDKSPTKEEGPPPSLPRLAVEDGKPSHPHSPDQVQYRKRRRMRSADALSSDRFFPDFCPPRAELGRPASPEATGSSMQVVTTPIRRHGSRDDDSILEDSAQSQGCGGLALDMMGAATGSFCLAPSGWRR